MEQKPETMEQKPKEKQKKQRKKRPMRRGNRPEILLTGWLFGLLFAGLIAYLSYFTATSEQEMIDNSYNSRRQEILLSRNFRGTIFARGGEVLAETVLDEEQRERRVYPYGKTFSHIVGYASNGRMGVEAQANYYLINTSIALPRKVANDAAGVKNPGDNVYTTLDVSLQEEADRQLSLYQGAVIVTEVSTGRILAMVSHPDFDPNRIRAIWNDLLEDPESSVLVNRATQGLYPPGSTFKIVTALEYLREHPEDSEDYTFRCTGSFQHGSDRISCYHGISHGRVDFVRSFVKSCNSSFANIGMGLDQERFEGTLARLLFGVKLPASLPCGVSTAHIGEDVPDSELMQTVIGQGRTQVTPLHLNMITCAIANGGVLMEPYVIERIESADGRLVRRYAPKEYGELMTALEAEELTELMTAATGPDGTAKALANLSFQTAGKTGSAEFNNVKGDSHAWFTGFAPADDPQIAVTVIVEEAGSGGEHAVPIAKALFERYLRER